LVDLYFYFTFRLLLWPQTARQDAAKPPIFFPAELSCLDHFIGKQGRNEGDSDQTAKEDQIGNLLDPKAQAGPMRIPDRKV
jgi:hypothetical protein